MISEKLSKKIKTINERFKELGFDLEEDLLDLVNQREDIANLLKTTKFKKMSFIKDDQNGSYIIGLDSLQIEFIVTLGKDEEGLWYETRVELIYF